MAESNTLRRDLIGLELKSRIGFEKGTLNFMRTIRFVGFAGALIAAWTLSGMAEQPEYLEGRAFSLVDGKFLDVGDGEGSSNLRYLFEYDPSDDETRVRTYKPYVHVFAPEGESFLTKGEEGKYPHHRGIFTGWSKLGYGGEVYDLWHMKKGAAQVHREFVDLDVPEGAAGFAALIDWLNPEGVVMLVERREVLLYPAESGAYVDVEFTSELSALNGPVFLDGDPEHAGFQFRPNAEVVGNRSARYQFHRDDVNPKEDRDYPWVAMTYELEGAGMWTVQMMRDAGNPDDSRWSCYRDYGRFGNFFVGTIEEGETLSFTFRIRVTEGEAPSRERLEAVYEEWTGRE
ncbi:MAG: DUF6807 family protein [Verrucomicrobiota bacterium]